MLAGICRRAREQRFALGDLPFQTIFTALFGNGLLTGVIVWVYTQRKRNATTHPSPPRRGPQRPERRTAHETVSGAADTCYPRPERSTYLARLLE